MNRNDAIFVGVACGVAIVVFYIALASFTPNPLVWSVQHPDYTAGALVPVLPIAIAARYAWRAGKRVSAETVELGQSEAEQVSEGDGGPVARSLPVASGTFRSVEQLAVASVLERGKSVAEVSRTLKVRPATVERWVARARDGA